MNNDSPAKSLLIVFAVALVCSIVVSVAAVTLRPIQERNALVERSRHVIRLSGLVGPGEEPESDEILEAIEQLDIRLVSLDTGEFSDAVDVTDFDPRAARKDPAMSTALAPADDSAGLGRRPDYAVIYFVWERDRLARVILPVYGQGMWSTLYGYVALEPDLNTIAAMTFYEQAETAGLGDQVQSADWLAKWQGRKIYGVSGDVRFRVAGGPVEPGSPSSVHEVDAMTGATVTGDAVTRIIRFWLGPAGYKPFLDRLRRTQPSPPARGVDTA